MEDKKLSKYYGEIAEKLDEMIPVEWDNIILYAEETGDVSSASFYYNEKNEYKRDSKIGQLERRIRWAYNELGIIPKDEYEKELLEEYLEEQGKSLKDLMQNNE